MKNWISQLKLLILNTFLICGVLLINPAQAKASSFTSDLVYGFSFGFGGSGVDEDVLDDTGKGTVTASSSEDPGMLGISVEKFLNNKWSLALSHRRGFSFGPFSMNVGFTGLIARRYFLRSPTFLPKKSLKNSVTLQRWVPYVGLGFGIARGSIKREADAVDKVSGSGVYMGIHLGIDYHLYPTMILRPEFFTSATFMDDSKTPSTLNEYGLIMNFLFRL